MSMLIARIILHRISKLAHPHLDLRSSLRSRYNGSIDAHIGISKWRIHRETFYPAKAVGKNYHKTVACVGSGALLL